MSYQTPNQTNRAGGGSRPPRGRIFLAFFLMGCFFCFIGFPLGAEKSEKENPTEIQVPPPPFSEDIFPCSECHGDMEVNRERRELVDMHDDIVFDHDAKNRWCLDCHDAANRDKLHLAGGTLIDFKESYRLCGQCHGPKYRDWRAGIHGRRTGNWNGSKKYLLCAHCHNPHSPRFTPLKPEPVPHRPGGKK